MPRHEPGQFVVGSTTNIFGKHKGKKNNWKLQFMWVGMVLNKAKLEAAWKQGKGYASLGSAIKEELA